MGQQKQVKRYYWLKLKEEFFQDKEVKKLRKIAGGDTYTVIYLKLMLLSLKSDGRLYFDGIEDTFYEELALEIDEDAENVRVTLMYLEKMGLLQLKDDDEMYLTQMDSLILSESQSAQRVREHRARAKSLIECNAPKEAKSNALRQMQHRAKKSCEEKQHIPFIEDFENNKLYNGNYYLVMRRDKYKCAMCGSTEDLCVHHIDGFDGQKPENSNLNKMVALCRECYSKVHAGTPIPNEILESIGYLDVNEEVEEETPVVSNEITETTEIADSPVESEEIAEPKEEKKKTKEPKHAYGEYSHVRLTDAQYEKLCEEYGEQAVKRGIENVDKYCQMHGRTYKDYNLVLRSWGIKSPKLPRIPKPALPIGDEDAPSEEWTKLFEE